MKHDLEHNKVIPTLLYVFIVYDNRTYKKIFITNYSYGMKYLQWNNSDINNNKQQTATQKKFNYTFTQQKREEK